MELSEFCSVQSQQIAQEIIGTAPGKTTAWLFLEYTGNWSARSVDHNTLPTEVNDWLNQQAAQLSPSRVVFIKKSSEKPAVLNFYLALTGEKEQQLFHFPVDTYSQLFDLDLSQVATDPAAFSRYLSEETLYLVCTNSKRDQCCAKFGLPIFQAMNQMGGVSAWQCTHLGGHRYAPVVGVYPAGLYYRVMTPEDGAELVASVGRGEIRLHGFRGRNCYSEPVQAADYFLRQQTSAVQLNQYRVESAEQVADNWVVVFRDTADQTTHTITLQASSTEPLMTSCGVKIRMKPQPKYQFVSYQS